MEINTPPGPIIITAPPAEETLFKQKAKIEQNIPLIHCKYYHLNNFWNYFIVSVVENCLYK